MRGGLEGSGGAFLRVVWRMCGWAWFADRNNTYIVSER